MIPAARSVALLIPILLAACASGPRLATVDNRIPPVAADVSRIWFYRPAIFLGDGIQPDILLNGKPVGKAAPGGVFFVDTKPGSCDVSMQTEVTRHLTFVAPAGGQTYVEAVVEPGILAARVFPDLIDPAVGRQTIQSLHFTGKLPVSN